MVVNAGGDRAADKAELARSPLFVRVIGAGVLKAFFVKTPRQVPVKTQLEFRVKLTEFVEKITIA